MSLTADKRKRLWWLIGVVLVLRTLGASGVGTKLRVTHAPGAPVYKTAAVGQPLTTLPLNTTLDAELKQGDFWKITVDINGVKTTGYVHEFLVEEVGESAPSGDGAPIGRIKTQAELTAEIELKVEENKDLLTRPEGRMEPVVESLRSLIPRVFGIEDAQKQKSLACDLYLWIGHALSKQGDDAGATREFRNMFEVDYPLAKKATRYIVESRVSQLITTAEQQYSGTFIGYVLQVDTEPKEAVLKIDGEVAGRTPFILTTDKPKVTLEIEKEGFKPERAVVTLGETKTVKSYVLESVGRTLRVSSNPAGAAVFLDGQDAGRVTDCELRLVSYGPHRLILKKDLYADWEEELTVEKAPGDLSRKAVLVAKAYASAATWGTPDGRGFPLPTALAIDRAGNYYVADESPAKVRKFNANRGGLNWGNQGKSFKALKQPSGIAVDSEGSCYITDGLSSSVTKFDKSGLPVLKWGTPGKEGSLSRPLGIAVDGKNDVYVVDTGNCRIVKYSSTGVLKKAWGRPGPGQGEFTSPTGVAINSLNEVIVTDLGRFQKFTSEGVCVGAFGKAGSAQGELGRPLGVCCDLDDNIYVADGKNNCVLKFAPNGKYVGSFGSSGTGPDQMRVPINVAANDKGSIFVLERDNNRIQEFRVASK